MSFGEFDGYEEDPETVQCPDCGEIAYVTLVDEGVGKTEYWGSVANHQDWRKVTTCCLADV